MNKSEAITVIEIVNNGWPGREIGKDQAKVMIAAILDLPFALTQDVVAHMVMTDQFRPPIAEIRRNVAKRLGLLPPPVDIATLAAAEWLERRAQWGFVNGSGWTPPKVDRIHPLIERIARNMSTEHGSWVGQFQRAYAAALSAEIKTVLATPFATVAELESGR